MSKPETITLAAKDWDAVTASVIKAHPRIDDTHDWSISIRESTDEAAIRGAAARGLIAYSIERKIVRTRARRTD